MISAVREKCAGLDVHRDTVVACVMWGRAEGEAQWRIEKFGTTAAELEKLKNWLEAQQCREVVAESTGPYWEPVLHVLEGSCHFCLANPQEVKNRRGHKTDKKDAWWLAHLFRHDMIRASYLPTREVRELRMLTRRRREVVRAAAQEKNRIQKLLEQSSIKLRSVLSDVFGASGAAMLEALIVDGETDPQRIAERAKGSLVKKKGQIAAALEGFHLPAVHRFLLRQALENLAHLVEQVDALEAEIQQYLQAHPNFAQSAELVKSVTGINQVGAAETIAEVGPDVKAFPGAPNLSSWAGVCPGNHESAGKRSSSRVTKGNPYWRATLIESAWAASRTKGSQFQACYQRHSPKLQHKGAILAVAHALVYAVYNVLNYQRPYLETATAEIGQAKAKRLIRHHQSRIKHLNKFLSSKPKPELAYALRRLETAG
jgi:transposase